MSDEQEYRLYRALIFWFGLISMTAIVGVTAYNITDRVGPVKPYVHQEYSWPDGTPPKVTLRTPAGG